MQTIAPYILYIHSIIRYFILVMAAVVVVQSLIGLLGKKYFKKGNRIAALVLLIFCDLQLLAGLALYYSRVIAPGVLHSPDLMTNVASRFYAIEHSLSMIVGIVLVHMGYSFTKKDIESDAKFKRLFWCSFIALAIFMAMIPWPGKQVVGRPYMPVMPA